MTANDTSDKTLTISAINNNESANGLIDIQSEGNLKINSIMAQLK